MSKNIVTFGEIMMRLATPGHLRFIQSNHLEMTFGGGEANVAVSLSLFGHHAALVTRLPSNPLGDTCEARLKMTGVDTRHILRGGERLGIYFLETGASQRASTVTYDRAHSSISTIDPADLDWEKIFEGVDWFHFTGITPALSEEAAQATLSAAQAARQRGIQVSCDLNFRKKLWSTAQAQETMSKIVPFVDVCIANEEDAEKVFGIKAGSTAVESGQLDHQRYVEVAEQLTTRFGFASVAITLRESISASRNGWSAMLYTGGQAHFSKRYDITIVDRVGGGDSFAAGLIDQLVQGIEPATAIEFAVAASCLKHSILGDFNYVSRSEVAALMSGDGSGRVQR